jgi:cobalamin synthase
MKRAWAALKFLSLAGRFGSAPGTPEQIGASAVYFPVVGLLLGMILIGFNRLFDPLVESEIGAAIVITVLIVLTGAIHMEGLQRTFDILLAPRHLPAGARPLTIYGILAVVLVIMFKIRAVEVMGETRNISLLLAPAFARWAVVLFLYGHAWAGEESAWRMVEKVTLWHLALATLATLGLAVFLTGRAGLWVGLWVSILALLSRGYFQRRHTGFDHDKLGALIEVSETLALVHLASM